MGLSVMNMLLGREDGYTARRGGHTLEDLISRNRVSEKNSSGRFGE